MSAAPRSIDSASMALARRLLSLIDLTSLNDSDDAASILQLTRLARTDAGRVAAVCTWQRLVPVACRELRGSGIAVAAVANFPAGDADSATAAAETADAVADGATEVDVVFPYRQFLAGNVQLGLALVHACRRACGTGALLKVILETGQLDTADNIRRAADIAIAGGAHFLKTSTGKTTPGATCQAAAVLLEAIAAAASRGQRVGVKVSGGIRTLSRRARIWSCTRCALVPIVRSLELQDRRLGAGAGTARHRTGARYMKRAVFWHLCASLALIAVGLQVGCGAKESGRSSLPRSATCPASILTCSTSIILPQRDLVAVRQSRAPWPGRRRSAASGRILGATR